MKQTNFYSPNSGMRFYIGQEGEEEDKDCFCAAPNDEMDLEYTILPEIFS